MPSSPQVVPVVVLFDYLLSDTGVGMNGQRVTVVLNSTAPATSVSPPTVIAQVQQSTTTDQNGYWQFSLVPNTNISPANTTYTVLTPAGTYDVTLGAVGPYQSTALGTIVNVPVPLTAPAPSSIPSLLVGAGEPGIDTVGAGALLLGDNTATSVEIGSGAVPVTINGQVVAVSSTGVQINAAGDISARSLTLSSSGPYTPNAPTGGEALGGSLLIGGPNPWIDVKAPSVTVGVTTYTLGAKGDGVTNDTTALQNAETAAGVNGAKIFYPTGTYIINAQITLNASNVSHAGAGRYAAVIKRANATNAHMFHCTSAVNAEFLDMGFDENGANNATTPHGIWLDQNSSAVLVERCQFVNCDGFAVYVFSSNPPVRVNNLRIIDCEFVQNAGGTHDLATAMSNGGAVIGCRFTIGGVNAGLCVYEANDMPVIGNVFVGQGTGAKLVQIASVLGCPFNANTILCGANDICIWLICENDNANNRNCIDVVISGNTIRNSGANTNGSTGIFFNGGTQANKSILSTVISDNIFDSVGLPIYYFGGVITGVTGHHNDFTGSNTPTINRNVVPTAESWDHNRGYNPLTVTTPAVSTPLTNTFAVDVFVSFIANAAGSTFTVNGKALAATPANAQGGFYWPANTVISYVNAPASWAFIGL